MTGRGLFDIMVWGWFGLAAVIFISLFFFTAPYGRHARRGWGLTVDNRLGWIIMESVSPLVFLACFILGEHRSTIPAVFFLALWEGHYIQRAFIYPFTLRTGRKRMPALVMSLGVIFNAVNAWLNGSWLYMFSGGYPNDWVLDPRFVAGAVIFVVGFIANRTSDNILRELRPPGGDGYRVPRGGLYRWISCPNYLGEILIWGGWALATWSLAGLSFAAWTAANLIPRARAHHHWYGEKFPNYPDSRKALIPFIW
jgi:protein-S-isoprenylcysteine O-methyltransferase Ste14